MNIGIVGSGHIGATSAQLLAAAGHEVAISHSGAPGTLRDLVARLGPHVRATSVEDAARFGDVVLLALPWRNRAELPAAAFSGKIVVDATNPYAPDFSLYDLGDSTSSEEVAKALPGARLVKAFNTLQAQDLASLGRPDLGLEDRFVLFLAGDDRDAKRLVANLVEEIGFAPVDTGSLREGGKRQQPGSPVYARRLTPGEARARLAAIPEGPEPEQPSA